MVIELPKRIQLRLNALAKTSGLDKATLVREAILASLDDLEDFYLGEARARENRRTIPLDDVISRLSIDG
jgi:RHH-type transcriptional regulator, rel operon repressor / antitoxin RelB